MPLDNSVVETEKDLAALAAEFQVEHPLLAPPAYSSGDEESSLSMDEEGADEQELLPEAAPKTKLTWKESSWLRIAIVIGALGLIGAGLVGLLSFQWPELEGVSISKARPIEEQKEEDAFAEDGDWVAQAAYADQQSAFAQFDDETKNDKTPADKKNPQTSKAPSASHQSRPQTTASTPRITPSTTATTFSRTPPPRAITRIPAPPRRVSATPPRPFLSPSTSTSAITRKPAPVLTPSTPTPPKQTPQLPPQPVQQAAPIQTRQTADPMEQWKIASASGVMVGNPDQIPEAVPIRDTIPFSSIGVSIPLGAEMEGQLETPIAFSEGIQGEQTVVIGLSPSDFFPNGAQLIASYTPTQGSSKDLAMSLTAESFLVDGVDIPIPEGSVMVSGKKGKPLIAKQDRSGGGFGNTLGRILLGGGREALGLVNRPQSQNIVSNGSTSSQTTNFGDPDILAGAGFGMADQLLDGLESRQSEPTLNGVWSVKPGSKIELHFLQGVAL